MRGKFLGANVLKCLAGIMTVLLENYIMSLAWGGGGGEEGLHLLMNINLIFINLPSCKLNAM